MTMHLTLSDFHFLLMGARNTVYLSAVAIFFGTLWSLVLGWPRATAPRSVGFLIGMYADIHRSVPPVVQVILVNSAIGIFYHPIGVFASGAIVLTLYMGAFGSEIVRGGILSVNQQYRRAARSLGMTYLQDVWHVVLPLGIRAMLPSWVGLVLGVIKDSALVSAIGYIELLGASRALITRTFEPLIILLAAGCIYFIICFAIDRTVKLIERRIQL